MSQVCVRRAAASDLPAIGRLGVLLVRTHRQFDRDRFMAETPRTEYGHASCRGTQLEDAGVPRIVLSTAQRTEGAQRLFGRTGFRRTMIEMTREAR